MNFLDNDFPEVTEAYRGSLEDWLELFERYAFPRIGDTETSTEMQRIFKRYAEVTYEDWLDIIIKCARDEIWYEEKINLSIRELYLVVRKYPRIEKKLKANYNKFNINDSISLTEDDAVGYLTDIETNTEPKPSIPNIIKNLNAFSIDKKELTHDEKTYWLKIKQIVEKKYRRKSDSSDSDWSSRLLNNFIKTYYAENAIFDSLTSLKQNEGSILIEYGNATNDKKGASLTIKELGFSDTKRNDLYLTSYELGNTNEKSKVVPDINCVVDLSINGVTIRSNLELKLECKSIRGSKGSSIHRANIVAYYDVKYTDQGVNGSFYLEPQQSFASKVFNKRDKNFSIKANEIDLFIDGFRNADCKNSAEDSINFVTIKNKLDYIAKKLGGQSADLLSDERINTLNNVTTRIADLLPDGTVLNLKTTGSTPNGAARKLEQTTDTLVKTILNAEDSDVLTQISNKSKKKYED